MNYLDAFISIAASSQPSPLSLAVHLQVTKPGDACTVVIDIVGLPVPWRIILVGIGFVWSTPEIEYAPTTACVGPFIVTIISPVPVEFVIYQNSASWL